jgi:drug/metabolite transporter (DMT)-like permease
LSSAFCASVFFRLLFTLIFNNRAVCLHLDFWATVFLSFLPEVVMIGAYIWMGETVTTMKVTGALAVIAGVVLTFRGFFLVLLSISFNQPITLFVSNKLRNQLSFFDCTVTLVFKIHGPLSCD